MPKFVRVRDESTGHEFTTARVVKGLEVLEDKPAVDVDGRPLPAKPRVAPGDAAKSAKADESSASTDKPAERNDGRGGRSHAPQATDKKE